MKTTMLVRAFLASSALVCSGAVLAQEPAAEATEQPMTESEADAAIAAAAPTDDANAKIELLQAQVEALQEALEQVKAAQVKSTPNWKGAPQFEDKEAGWSFKPRGRIQYDVGYVSNPDDRIGSEIFTQPARNLGFNTRARRLRLGAEGSIPGGFQYKFEADFAGAAGSGPNVTFGDVTISYVPAGKPWNVTLGNHETLNGMEQITSSRFISFLERGAFNDGFINTRRIGISAGAATADNVFRLNTGLYAAKTIDNSFDNKGWIAAARAVYAPIVDGNQLHFGLNFQHRNFSPNNGSVAGSSQGAPSSNQLARYRARPFTQTTDVRFIDTRGSGSADFAAQSDNILGVELAGVFKSLHVHAEGQMNKVNVGHEPGDVATGLDAFPSTSVVVPDGNLTFWGGFLEAGYYLTGETRPYKASKNGLWDNGTWDRTKVLSPFSKGGWGAIQLNGRIDYLDLDSSKLKNALTNNFTNGSTSLRPVNERLSRGGKQLGFQAGLVWIPEDYFRVLLNYSHAKITGGPFAATVKPDSDESVDDRSYGVDVVAARVQVDF